MDQTILAYTAGIIDGEGYIGINPNTTSYRAIVRVNMAHQETVKWLYKNFGGRFGTIPREAPAEDMFSWDITKKDTIKIFLEDILPYLKTKRVTALIAIEFCTKFPIVIGKHNSQATRDDMALYYRVMAVANSKGKGSSEKKLILFNALEGKDQVLA